MPQSSSRPPSARRVAMDYLARREHSEAELRQKLAAKGFEREIIDAALQDLVDEGLASDARFAEAFAANRARRGQGPLRIRVELQARGVAEELIAEQLQGRDWVAAAAAVRAGKFGPEPPADYRDWARQARFLQNRGFSGEQVRTALGSAGED